jgi:hypothetical protein
MPYNGQGPKDDCFGKLDRNVKTGLKEVCDSMRRIYIVVLVNGDLESM